MIFNGNVRANCSHFWRFVNTLVLPVGDCALCLFGALVAHLIPSSTANTETTFSGGFYVGSPCRYAVE